MFILFIWAIGHWLKLWTEVYSTKLNFSFWYSLPLRYIHSNDHFHCRRNNKTLNTYILPALCFEAMRFKRITSHQITSYLAREEGTARRVGSSLYQANALFVVLWCELVVINTQQSSILCTFVELFHFSSDFYICLVELFLCVFQHCNLFLYSCSSMTKIETFTVCRSFNRTTNTLWKQWTWIHPNEKTTKWRWMWAFLWPLDLIALGM